jgi:hypothetical protein
MTGVREEVCSLPEGPAVCRWPCPLSPAAARDLEDWLRLVLRKARRTAGPPPAPWLDPLVARLRALARGPL